MRDDTWLQTRFDQIWNLFFPDVEKKNVFVRWKGRWKNKFGHIKKTNGRTEIAINSLFRDPRVPEDIIKLTMAHEIVHYMHGFHSHLPRQHSHPNAHGVVDRELINKGFGYAMKNEKKWVKEVWWNLYKELQPEKAQKLQQRRIERRLHPRRGFLKLWFS